MIRTATVLMAAVGIVAPAAAQVQRGFPQNALRGAHRLRRGARDRRSTASRRGSRPAARIRDAQQHGGRVRARCIGGKLPRQLHGRHLAAWSRTSGSCARTKRPASPGRRRPRKRRPGASIRSRRSGSSRERRRRERKPKVFIKTFGCQMNEYDSDKMADVLHAAAGLRADRRRRRGRPDPVQHLLGAREGAGEGVQRPRPRQAPEGQGRADRRRRLRRQPGRRGDHRARALRRRGVRPADAAPPAGDAGAARERSGRPQVDISFPEIEKFDHLPPARVDGADAPSSRSWKAAPSTAATASCPTRAAKKSRARSTTCWSRSPAWPTRACKEVTLLGPERQRLPRRDGRQRPRSPTSRC